MRGDNAFPPADRNLQSTKSVNNIMINFDSNKKPIISDYMKIPRNSYDVKHDFVRISSNHDQVSPYLYAPKNVQLKLRKKSLQTLNASQQLMIPLDIKVLRKLP